MNILLTIGLLLITGYAAGFLMTRIGLPKIIGYIITGIVFSPNTVSFVEQRVLDATHPLMDVCLAFIVFEIGGALKWSKIRKHENEIISITLAASIFPYILIAAGILGFDLLFPGILSFGHMNLLYFSLILGALASPTDPTATFAVMHQYKSKGKVSDTIVGIAALDDALGILLFSLTLGIISIFTGSHTGLFGNPIANSVYQIAVAILTGLALGILLLLVSDILRIKGEGQWVIVVFAIIIFGVGISKVLQVDEVLTSMTIGIVVANKCKRQKEIYRILERYTEDMIFLFFFLLSGLHLDITTIPKATILILIFVALRTTGKYAGADAGARLVNADPVIRKNTAGGLLPQGGIVIGLVLSIYANEAFKEISEIMLTTTMGTVIVFELIGPLVARHSLKRSGEIKNSHEKSGKS